MVKKQVKTEKIKEASPMKADKSQNKNIDLLIENSIDLQKVLANLAVSVDDLSKDVKKMLNLFTEAGKAFAEGKKPIGEKMGKTEVMVLRDRLDGLIEQNKEMASGIILLENYLKGKTEAKEEKEESKLKKLPQYNF